MRFKTNEIIAKYEKLGKYMPLLHEVTCNKYCLIKRWLNSNVATVILLSNDIELRTNKWKQKLQVLTLLGHSYFYYSYFDSDILYYVDLFYTRWPFAINLFSNLLFQALDYYETFYETFTVINSVTRILLIETP